MQYNLIGIIGAMDEEIELLHKNVVPSKQSKIAGVTFYEGSLFGQAVVYCKSGVGKVNAAICTQVLLSFSVDCVWFTGVAGALDQRLDVGDIVISSSAMQHDMDVTPLGYAKGIIPDQAQSEFIADEALINLAKQAGDALYIGRTLVGKVLSGDQFIASVEKVEELHNTFNGVCAEMEGAAVAQVCNASEVPFIIIRSMSDKADGSADVTYKDFVVQAADNSYKMIEYMITHLNA